MCVIIWRHRLSFNWKNSHCTIVSLGWTFSNREWFMKAEDWFIYVMRNINIHQPGSVITFPKLFGHSVVRNIRTRWGWGVIPRSHHIMRVITIWWMLDGSLITAWPIHPNWSHKALFFSDRHSHLCLYGCLAFFFQVFYGWPKPFWLTSHLFREHRFFLALLS